MKSYFKLSVYVLLAFVQTECLAQSNSGIIRKNSITRIRPGISHRDLDFSTNYGGWDGFIMNDTTFIASDINDTTIEDIRPIVWDKVFDGFRKAESSEGEKIDLRGVHIRLVDCHFGNRKEREGFEEFQVLLHRLTIDHASLENFVFNNITAESVSVWSSKLTRFEAQVIQADIEISDCKFVESPLSYSFIDINNASGSSCSIHGNTFPDAAAAPIYIQNAKYEAISFQSNQAKKMDIFLTGDSLGMIFIDNSYVRTSSDSLSRDSIDFLEVSLFNCSIANFIQAEKIFKGGSIRFERCVFKNGMEFLKLGGFDTVEFVDCVLSGSFPLFLSTDKPVYLTFEKTNVNNVEFSFTNNIHLIFSDGVSADDRTSTFETLLEKFKSKWNYESYKNLDLKYAEFKWKNTWYGAILFYANKLWWNFGYNKGYIIGWTLFFLCLFVVLNWKWWVEMQQTYHLISTNHLARAKKDPALLFIMRKLATVFLYTSYVFFALRIDFDRLKHTNLRFTTLFFFQYLVGALCLLFIVNFVLKIV
jgi:hypothetical protein